MAISFFFRTGMNSSIAKVFNAYIGFIEDKKIYEMPKPRASLGCILRNMVYTFRHRNLEGINHVTGDIHYVSLVLPRNLTVLTIHDMGTLSRAHYSKFKYLLIYYLWFFFPIRYCKYVTCISEFTKEELLSFFPWAENRISVIPNPVNERFKFLPKSFNDQKPVILHVGVNENKNLYRVIQALQGVYCELHIIGKLDKEIQLALEQYGIEYKNLYDISDEEMVSEYVNCDIVSFPSMFEGFGLPILEGFATGRVVVTSNIEPMLSLSEDAAILVNPLDVNSIREGFLLAIENKELREKKVIAGKKVVEKYKPSVIYEQYNFLYAHILQESI